MESLLKSTKVFKEHEDIFCLSKIDCFKSVEIKCDSSKWFRIWINLIKQVPDSNHLEIDKFSWFPELEEVIIKLWWLLLQSEIDFLFISFVKINGHIINEVSNRLIVIVNFIIRIDICNAQRLIVKERIYLNLRIACCGIRWTLN